MKFEQYLKTPHVVVKNAWLRKMSKTSMTGDSMSEIICMIFDENLVSIGDLADEMGTEIPKGASAVWEKKRKTVQKEIIKATQEALNTRGLSNEFKVYRGGDVHEQYSLIPVSLSPQAAYNFTTYTSSVKDTKKPLYSYTIKKSDVIADVAAIRGPGKGFEQEHELLLYKTSLKNAKKIDTTKPSWWNES